jgi:hypothetical protein
VRHDVPVPSGATTGDRYLLAVRCEGDDSADLTVNDVAFTPLTGTVGEVNNWQRLWERPYDGNEPGMWHIDGVATRQVGADAPGGANALVLGAAQNTVDDNTVAPTHTISAVTTTVNESLILFGYISYWAFTMDTDVALSPATPVLLLSADDTTPVRVWTLEVAAAGTVGPWVADRSEESGLNPYGVLSWTVVAPPSAGALPTIVNHVVAVGFPYVTTQPPPRYLTGPNGEQVVIQRGTLADQNAAVAKQLAEWAAVGSVASYLAAVDGFITDNAAFLASPGSSDPELVDVVGQLQSMHAALKQRFA